MEMRLKYNKTPERGEPLSKVLEARRQWNDIFKVIKEYNWWPEIPYLTKIFLIMKLEFKCLRQILREFTASKLALKY